MIAPSVPHSGMALLLAGGTKAPSGRVLGRCHAALSVPSVGFRSMREER
ncbi:hypothetical protein [Streptoalloteichus tenebrarius]|nr:hypothetical protein [Streptoalloteichus tenebrarius]